MEEKKIILISFGHFERAFLGKITEAVSNEYHLPAYYEEGHIEINDYYSPGRRQYDGNMIIAHLNSLPRGERVKTAGLFRVDLFIPILTYIFGQAVLNGNTCIASVFRLRNELYGLKKDEDILLERFKKEVIHELGHTCGLIHCHTHTCVMRSSTYVEDIDQKSSHLCAGCLSSLKK